MKVYLVLVLSLSLLLPNVQAVLINEFMPDPDDGCYDCSEWIEITSYENLSLENITVDTGEHPITLNGSIRANEFIIITKNSSAFLEIWDSNVTIFENRKMSLRNMGDNITLYSNLEILQIVEYPSSANNISYSLCNSSFMIQNISTPGFPNTCDPGETNGTKENQTETVNNTCDLYVWIKCNLTFNMGSNKYYPMVEDLEGNDFEPEIEYWIEDMFGNIVRSKFKTNNTNVAKSWTPPEIKGTEAYVIHTVITNQVCNDTNLSNNAAEKLIIVKGNEAYSDCSCKTEIIEKSCSCGPCPECESEEETEKDKEFEILSYHKEIRKNEEIEIKVGIKNPSDKQRNYTLYSYVYEGNTPLSLGFDGEKWLNTWNANKQEINTPRNSSLTFTLKNRIANDTEPGKYKLRVRIWSEGKKNDITKEIVVKESLTTKQNDTGANQTIGDENMTEENRSFAEIKIPTGEIISENKDNWLSLLIENVINFFKNLFNL